MLVIDKYELKPDVVQEAIIPKGYRIISAVYQGFDIVIYFIADDEETELCKVEFRVIRLDEPFQHHLSYKFLTTINTGKAKWGSMVWHIFYRHIGPFTPIEEKPKDKGTKEKKETKKETKKKEPEKK